MALMRSTEAENVRFAAWPSRLRVMTWSRTWALPELAKSRDGIGVAGLVLGRMKAKSRSLSRRTTSAGNSAPSSKRILTSPNSVSILNLGSSSPASPKKLCIMSPGSMPESDRMVRPEASTTVPVTSRLDSLDWPPMPRMENLLFSTSCTVTIARWFCLKISRPFSASSSPKQTRHSEGSRKTKRSRAELSRTRIAEAFQDNELIFPVRFEFKIGRVDAALHFDHHGPLLPRRDLLHQLFHRIHV